MTWWSPCETMRDAPVTSTVRTVGRFTARDLRLADAAAAVCLSAIVVATEFAQGKVGLTGTLAGVVVSSTVAFRRRAPVSMAVLAAAGVSVAGSSSPAQLAGSIAFVLDYYLVGRKSAERGWTWIDAALLALPVLGIVLSPGTPEPGDPFVVDVVSVWAFFFVIPFAAGRIVGGRIALTAALQVNTERLAEQQRERTRQVAAAERTRIARELHDVIAHSVSVMVVQAAAANDVFDTRPERAREALRAIEASGRTALAEMRRLLGVVRADGAEYAPQPGIDRLDNLVEQVRAAGLAVAVSIEGAPRPLPAGVDLSAYRVVQEALTNTLKHANATRADVSLRYRDDELCVEVRDDGEPVGNGDGHGRGLIGMRERVTAFGGSLETGPKNTGGFAVSARFPL